MPDRRRVLWIPARVDFGPYRSLERVELTTRNAIAERFDLAEIDIHPGRDPERFLAAFVAAGPLDAVVDHSDHALHGPITPTTPTLYFALGGMTNGATFPWLRRPRLKTTDVLLMNCKSDLVIYERTLGGTGPRAELMPFGVDVATFRPRSVEENRATRASLGLPDDAFVVLHAGRLNVQKNVHGALLVFRELAARSPRAHLVLAGAFDEIAHTMFAVTNEGYEGLIRELISQWGLEERVRFTGLLGDEALARTYAAADAFLTLTLHNNENFGYAPVEAMACGTPVVAAHFGGLKETVVHGETGWHVETLMTDHGLRAVWRQAVPPLVRLLQEPALGDRIGAAAVRHVRSELSLEAYADRLEGAIRRAVERARTEPGEPGKSFVFSKPAMDLHLRNLYRTFLRSEGRQQEKTGPRVEYPSYRFFQGPYATRDVADVRLRADDPLTLVSRCRLDRKHGRLESLDPIWPRGYPLSPVELDAIAGIEPGVTHAELVERGLRLGLTRERMTELVSTLLADGVLYRDRAFAAG